MHCPGTPLIAGMLPQSTIFRRHTAPNRKDFPMQLLVIYDTESSYTIQLARMLGRERSFPFEVHAFTEKEKLTSFLRIRHVSVLLVAEKDYAADLEAEHADLLLILKEGRGNRACASLAGISKYQSGPSLVRDILACYAPAAKPLSEPLPLKETGFLGVFSPIGRCGKSLFALALALQLSETRSVLLISFDQYSSFPDLAGGASASSLSDLLSFMDEEDEALFARITKLTLDWHGIRYLPPVRLAQDITDLTSEDLRKLLRVLRRSGYDEVLLDFGPAVPDAYLLAEECSRIYLPVPDDPVSENKLRSFALELRAAKKEHLTERISRIRVPAPEPDLLRGSAFAERLLLSPIGALARQKIRKDRL